MNKALLKAPVISVDHHHETDHRKIQDLLTVEQIMTVRDEFLCCSVNDTLGHAFEGIPEVYDAIPVVDGPSDNATADVIGVAWRRDLRGRKPLARVEEIIDERSVENPLAASTPMLDFARSASADRMSLVGDGSKVVGLVTVYDLERLPVRLSLFQHILYFEQRLGQAIMSLAPDESTWPDLCPAKRPEIEDGIRRALRRDHLGAPILGIGFTEKVEIARKLLPDALGVGFNAALLDDVAPFRNDVAHGLPFRRVEDVPNRIRQIDDLLGQISPNRIQSIAPRDLP